MISFLFVARSLAARLHYVAKRNKLQSLSWLVKLCGRLAIGFWLTATSLAFAADQSFVVLSYHDVEDAVAKDLAAGQTAVSSKNLVAQFEWLKKNRYHVVSIQDLLDARDKKKTLPEKAVLLTFDDGYASFYDKVFPLLKKFHYPAMVAVVSSWMDGVAKQEELPGSRLMSWDQVKELSRSGLVEVASHSHNLHRGMVGNPQGNEQPVAVTHLYDPVSKTYEQDEAYLKRIRQDLRNSAESIDRAVGIRPRVLVWPYGEYNQPLIDAAKEAGMTITMELSDGKNTLNDLSAVRRLLVAENPEIQDFASMMKSLRIGDRPLHVVHVDLDYIYDADSKQTERNLGALVDRIRAMGVNTVYLQAYADPDGDGNAEALYFPNRHLPMRADLFNRASWQLLTRARVKVYAWMPVLAFRIKAPDSWFVHEWRDGKAQLASHIYKRLSPFNADARRVAGEIYQDLAKYCHFTGLLFHDDAILSDYEDVTPEALTYAGQKWSLPEQVGTLRSTPEMRMRWAQHKSMALIQWTEFLAEQVRYYRPAIKTARNYYALPLLQPDSEEWFAQSFASGLEHYDYVAVEAMPWMEKAENPDRWLEELLRKAAKYPHGLEKTVFELQTVDWNTQREIPMDALLKQISAVQRLGAVHVGYYPDNVHHNHPRLADMEQAFALPVFP